MLLVSDQGTVYILRYIPSEGFIKPVVFRRTGKILISPYHMGYPHEMIVDDICEIIGWKSVALDQYHIVKL